MITGHRGGRRATRETTVPSRTLRTVGTPDQGNPGRLKDGRGRFARSLETARKRDRAVELRAKGWTYAAIAAETGYAHASAAMRAINTALSAIPQASCEELIAQETARLEEIDATLAAIVERPPIRTTSIGRTQFDVRTCTCPTRARTDRDHDPDCQVQPVLDMGIVVQAAKARIAVGESLRRMRGADKPPQPPRDEIARQYAAAMAAATAKRDEELAELNGLRALAAAIPRAGDDDITEGEVVDP